MKTLCLPINLMAVKSITLQRAPPHPAVRLLWSRGGGHLVQIRGDGFKLMMLSGRARGGSSVCVCGGNLQKSGLVNFRALRAATNLEKGSWQVALLICKAGLGQIQCIQARHTAL